MSNRLIQIGPQHIPHLTCLFTTCLLLACTEPSSGQKAGAPQDGKQNDGAILERNLVRSYEQRLLNAKSLSLKFRYQLQSASNWTNETLVGEGTLLLKHPDKVFISATRKTLSDQKESKDYAVSDGTSLKAQFAGFAPLERKTPAGLSMWIVQLVVWVGAYKATIFGLDPRDPSGVFTFAGFAGGPTEGSLKCLQYGITIAKTSEIMPAKLWVDPDTGCPIRRLTEIKVGEETEKLQEEYLVWNLDPQIPDEQFKIGK